MLKNSAYEKTIFFVLLMLAAASWYIFPAAAFGAPKLTVGDKEHNFGEAYAGSEVFHTFQIENAGDADLLVKSVRTG